MITVVVYAEEKGSQLFSLAIGNLRPPVVASLFDLFRGASIRNLRHAGITGSVAGHRWCSVTACGRRAKGLRSEWNSSTEST